MLSVLLLIPRAIVLLAFFLIMTAASSSGHAGGVTRSGSTIQARAPGQSEQAINGSRGSKNIGIAAASSIAGAILITVM